MGPEAGGRYYLLVFVTTSCHVCAATWELLGQLAASAGTAGDTAAASGALPAAPVPLVVVTPSRSTEDEARARRLSPPGALIHMSSDTWFMYGVAQAGTFLLVKHSPGAPPPWDEPAPVLGRAVPADTHEVDELLAAVAARCPSPGPSSAGQGP